LVAFGISLILAAGDSNLGCRRLLVRAMGFIWAVILVGGIAYFSVIGLTHH
jgi:hypothetical protein